MTKVGLIVQVRMGSTRLPNKALLNLGKESMLEFLIRRIKDTGYPITLATTRKPEDDIIESTARRLGVGYFRGSETNVLERLYLAARRDNLDVIVRLTADNPFVESDFIIKHSNEFLREGWQSRFTSTSLSQTYPLGVSMEQFSFYLLDEAYRNAREQFELEHVTPYIYLKSTAEKIPLSYEKERYHYRLTVDTDEDIKLARILVEQYDCADKSIDEIVQVLDTHPELPLINGGIKQKRI